MEARRGRNPGARGAAGPLGRRRRVERAAATTGRAVPLDRAAAHRPGRAAPVPEPGSAGWQPLLAGRRGTGRDAAGLDRHAGGLLVLRVGRLWLGNRPSDLL